MPALKMSPTISQADSDKIIAVKSRNTGALYFIVLWFLVQINSLTGQCIKSSKFDLNDFVWNKKMLIHPICREDEP